MIDPCSCPVCKALLADVLVGGRASLFGGASPHEEWGYVPFIQRLRTRVGARNPARSDERSQHVAEDDEDHSVRGP